MSQWLALVDRMDAEDIETRTTTDQATAENHIFRAYSRPLSLRLEDHHFFWTDLYRGLPRPLVRHCSEEPWIPYWFLNGLSVLNLSHSPEFRESAAACLSYISKRKSASGYASSPQHCGHLVLAYVSINSIALAELESGYESIDRRELYPWLLSLKLPNGSFQAGPGFEADSRSTYCAISIASLLGLLTPELTAGVSDFLVSCQGYDGGFAPLPGIETHGGYGFTSVAALSILNELHRVDIPGAIRWCAMRQMQFSGGFNGRTNKLVDSCYTWWVGAMARTLADHAAIPPFWNEDALAQYVLMVCQSAEGGGLCDRPPSPPDLFHTMYGMAGLSAAARNLVKERLGVELAEMDSRHAITKEAADKIKVWFAARPFAP
jgi:protein farnesyltransferase subunit beta